MTQEELKEYNKLSQIGRDTYSSFGFRIQAV